VAERALRLLLYATVLLVPLIIDIGTQDSFRYPKELTMRAGCILMGGVLAACTIAGGWQWMTHVMSRRVRILLAAIILWTIITAAVSTNPVISAASACTLGLYVILFISVSLVGASRRSFTLVTMLLISAAINSVVLLLQATQIWSPFSTWIPLKERIAMVALLGNPNDVGGYLAPVVILGLAGGLTCSRVMSAAGVLAAAAVLASQTLTAIIGMTAGLIALMVVRYRWRGVYAAISILAVMMILLMASPVRQRASKAIGGLRAGNLNLALSNRLTAFVAAWEMICDHPLFGVGPGCYGFEYFDYKIRAEARYPVLAESMSRATNFAEAHNDHLEIAAEAGIPGYLLFLAAISVAAGTSFRPPNNARTAEFARLIAFPTVMVLFVTALAHFPLQLTASTMIYVCAFGLINAWGTLAES
jgi:O-antigen ligase